MVERKGIIGTAFSDPPGTLKNRAERERCNEKFGEFAHLLALGAAFAPPSPLFSRCSSCLVPMNLSGGND